MSDLQVVDIGDDCPKCHRTGRRVGMRKKWWLFGELTITYICYYCTESKDFGRYRLPFLWKTRTMRKFL